MPLTTMPPPFPPPPFYSNCTASAKWAACSTSPRIRMTKTPTLIAYLARGRNYRTAYLSVTRGDGGQNVLGPDFGRRSEWPARRNCWRPAGSMAAGNFSRAVDFGFSKDYRETLSIWDREQVLSDMVRVIRDFGQTWSSRAFPPCPAARTGTTRPRQCWRWKPSSSPAIPRLFRNSSGIKTVATHFALSGMNQSTRKMMSAEPNKCASLSAALIQ